MPRGSRPVDFSLVRSSRPRDEKASGLASGIRSRAEGSDDSWDVEKVEKSRGERLA